MKIIIKSLANAEDNAMLQALYSRSAESVETHLKRVEEVGSGKFMSQYYLGYGHASIGDCGSDTVYIEGVSMLAAKAIEDNPLFAGQECSSRYIDFSTQPFYSPEKSFNDLDTSVAVANLYTKFRKFYESSLEPLKTALRERFPKKEDEKDAVYQKAIAARAFDILRGFLPAGATTNVAWSFRLSNAGEHLLWMMHHPLEEVRRIGANLYAMLYDKYPNSFRKDYAEVVEEMMRSNAKELMWNIDGVERWDYMSQLENFYTPIYDETVFTKVATEHPDFEVLVEGDFDEIAQLYPNFQTRVRKTAINKHSPIARRRMKIVGLLDFGSFRDIHRHRNGDCNMPLLTPEFGLHPWYYENLTEELRREAYILLNEVEKVYKELLPVQGNGLKDYYWADICEAQYILPMGYLVPVGIRYSVRQAVYVAELRSGKTVHATLRPLAQAIGETLVGMNVPVFYDSEESDWTIRRGEQDIVAKAD